MDCEKCGVMLRIGQSATVVEEGKAVTVQRLYCVNPECANGQSRAVVEELRHVHEE